jgi:hypothetical protein
MPYKPIAIPACEHCSRPFLASRPRVRFCSLRCASARRRTMRETACEHCAKQYRWSPASGRGRFCSRECHRAWNRAQYEQRLWSRILCDIQTGCWVWTGKLISGGYGSWHRDGKPRNIHLIVYERFVGPIPRGHEVDHLCLNRACCRPDHLEAVTPFVNKQRMNQRIAIREALRILHWIMFPTERQGDLA